MATKIGFAEDMRDTSNIAWEPWIQTVSGIKFHFLSGSVDEVTIEDIATALSRSPRWAGHTTDFFSVAQHSVIVSNLVKEEGGDIKEQLLGLLHDATEAYMCDIPSPLKRMIPEFKRIENKLWSKISRRFFGKVIPISDLVHECDKTVLATEARDLFAFPPIENWTKRCPPPSIRGIVPCGPVAAFNLFINKYKELSE